MNSAQTWPDHVNNIEQVAIDNAVALIVDKGYDPKMGARPLRRAIQRLIEDPLAELVLAGMDPRLRPYIALYEARLMLEQGQSSEAQAAARAAAEEHGQSALGIAFGVLHGEALARAGDAHGAKQAFDRALAGTTVMGIAMDPVWRAFVGVDTFTNPIIVLLAIVFLAVMYPAVKAATVQPVEAMRHQ